MEFELSEEAFFAFYTKSNPLLDATVLQGMATVDWSALTHAFGPAVDIPALLRAALSEVRKHREIAFKLLHSNICHQGTIYQATSHTVPFLIDMLTYDQTPDLAEVILLLGSISQSHAFEIRYSQKNGIDINRLALKNENTFYARESYEAVRKGIERYLPLIHHPLAIVRETTVRLLCSFPGDAPQILPVLYEQVQKELDDEIQGYTINSEIVEYLLQVTEVFSETRAGFVSLLEEIVRREPESIMTRFAAACAIAKLAPGAISDKALRTISFAIAHPEGVDPYCRFVQPDPEFIPPDMHQAICEGSTVDNALEAFSLLDPSKIIPFLIQGLAQAKRPDHAHAIAFTLLYISLLGKSYMPGPAILYKTIYTQESSEGKEYRTYPILIFGTKAGTYTTMQEAVVEAVRGNEKIRGIESNLLEAFGIAA